ncbi:MAG: ATP-binding protein [Bacteroidota bacterium]
MNRMKIDGWFLIICGLFILLSGVIIFINEFDPIALGLLAIAYGGMYVIYGVSMFFLNFLRKHVYVFMLMVGFMAMLIIAFLSTQGLPDTVFFPLILSFHVACSLLCPSFMFYLFYVTVSTFFVLGVCWVKGEWLLSQIVFLTIWGMLCMVLAYFQLWRRQVGREKRMQLKLFGEMLDQSSRAMFLLDMKQLELVSFNAPAESLLRQIDKPNDIQGSELLALLGFNLTYLKRRFGQIGKVWEEKSYFKLMTKAQLQLELEIVLRKLENQSNEYLLLRIQDITKLKAQERDLERSMNINQSLVSAIPDLLVSLSSKDEISSIQVPSQYSQKDFKFYQSQHIIALLNFLGMNQVDMTSFQAALLQLRKKGATYQLEFEGRMYGHTRYFDARLVSLGFQGEVLCIFRDVTEAFEKDRKLAQSESRYKTLVDHMKEGLLMTDVEGKTLFVNQRMAEILEHDTQDLLGKMSTDFLDIDLFSEGNMNKEGAQKTIEFTTSKGDLRHLYVAAAPFLDQQEKFLGTIAVVTDFSVRKATEGKLEEKKQELDDFMYKASHDLRGPLASIIGISNIAIQESKEEVSNNYFHLINQSAKRLDHILSELINLTRLNNATIEIKEIQLKNFVQDISQSLVHSPDAEKINFIIDIPEDFVLVSDEKLLLSILQNLVLNGILYRKKGIDDPFVRVCAEQKPNRTLLKIEDNGIGMPERIQNRVFEMFYRGNTKSKGSGLGLYIVKTAVDKLDGSIELESEEGRGSSFEISLPLQTV